MKIATVGVHVLDTHVIGIESIPEGSDGQLVETIRMSPAGTAGGTAVVLSRLGAEVTSYAVIGEPLLSGAVQVSVADWSPRTAVGATGPAGTPAGVTTSDGTEAGESPTSLVAVTVNR